MLVPQPSYRVQHLPTVIRRECTRAQNLINSGLPSVYDGLDSYLIDMFPDFSWNIEGSTQEIKAVMADAKWQRLAATLLAKRGYDLSQLRARQISARDFERFDYVLAMDAANIGHLKAMCPTRLSEKIELLLDYGGEHDETEVPDPYQGRPRDFEHALDLIEAACQGLLAYLLDLQRMRAAATGRV